MQSQAPMTLFRCHIRTLNRMAVSGMVAAISLFQADVTAADGTAHPPGGFFAGDYLIIGKAPENGEAYEGTASFVEAGEGLRLHKQISGRTTTWTGNFETPSPPGEGTVLRFRHTDSQTISTCLWTVDHDNYPRLSCLVSQSSDGRSPKVPGFESFYPVSSWPETARDMFTFPAR